MDNTSFTDAFPIKTLNKKTNPIATLITDYIWLPPLYVSTKSHDIPIDHPVFASPSRPSFEPLACDRPTPPAGVVPGNPMICAIITHDEKKQRFNGCWLNTNTAVTSICWNIYFLLSFPSADSIACETSADSKLLHVPNLGSPSLGLDS